MNGYKISDEVFKILLYLSRLEASTKECEALSEQVNRLVGYFKILDEFADEKLDNSMYNSQNENALRGDKIKKGLTASELKKMTEEYMDGYFRVPKVLGSGA